MKKIKLLLVIFIFVIVYYAIIIWQFYDYNRWAREYLYHQKLRQSGKISFDQKTPSFLEKAFSSFFNDFRNSPEKNKGNKNRRNWWEPNYSRKQKEKVARFLNKYSGKASWLKKIDLKNIQDSLMSFHSKRQQQKEKEFNRWLEQQGGGIGEISDEKALYYLISGERAFRYYEFDLAKKTLKQGLKICEDPSLKARFYQNLGFIEHENLNFEQAEEYFKKALEQDANYYGYYINIGWNYFLKQNFQKCLEYNLKAQELNQSSWIPHFNIAISYLAMKKYKQAFEYYQLLSQKQFQENTFFYVLEDLFILKKMNGVTSEIDFFIGYAFVNYKMFSRSREHFNQFLENTDNGPKFMVKEAEKYLNPLINEE